MLKETAAILYRKKAGMKDNSLEMRVWLVHLKDNTSTHNTFFIKASKMSVCDNDPYY